MLLCADIGGTNTKLALFRPDRPLEPDRLERYTNADARDFEAIVARFLPGKAAGTIEGACLGVAGPVRGTRVEATNLPWGIDATALGARLGGAPVFLLNDLEALAYAIPGLPEQACEVISPGR